MRLGRGREGLEGDFVQGTEKAGNHLHIADHRYYCTILIDSQMSFFDLV